jgi:hypothetical protein
MKESAMKRTKLEETEYKTCFDTLSKGLNNETAEIEIQAVSIMDQEETNWVPFYGISYDPSEKVISIICKYIDHHVKQPDEVWINADGKNISSIEITGGDGYIHIVKFKEPIAC